MKKTISALIVGLFLLPTVSFAQVTDPVVRAQLLQLLASLIEQVKVLQAQLDAQRAREVTESVVSAADTSTLQGMEDKLLAVNAEIVTLETKGVPTQYETFGDLHCRIDDCRVAYNEKLAELRVEKLRLESEIEKEKDRAFIRQLREDQEKAAAKLKRQEAEYADILERATNVKRQWDDSRCRGVAFASAGYRDNSICQDLSTQMQSLYLEMIPLQQEGFSKWLPELCPWFGESPRCA